MKSETVKMDGITFYRCPNAKSRTGRVYFTSGARDGERLLHRYIYAKHYGPIPAGKHIHHKDGNPLNNDISNLECLSASAHNKEHATDESRLALLEANKPRLAAMARAHHEWRKTTPEGQEFNRQTLAAAYAARDAKRGIHKITCELCKKEAEVEGTSAGTAPRFCSEYCRQLAGKIKRGQAHPERRFVCANCQKEGVTRKAKQRFCSRTCKVQFKNRRPT